MNLKSIEKVLFLKIETVPQYETFADAPGEVQKLFTQKHEEDIVKSGSYETTWSDKSSLTPEFGKVACISVGMIYNEKFVKKSFIADDEITLLNNFVSGKLIDSLNNVSGGVVFCSYSGESFDYPFLAKRLIMNGVMVPKFLFYVERKPWERHFLADIKSLWKWDSYNGNTSLKLLSYSLGLGAGDDIEGNMIKDIFYKEKDIKKIASHCENDIDLLYGCYRKLEANFANS